jgi:PAS domain S-box-containing protein
VCPQKAKIEHSEIDVVRELLKSHVRVAATVAPSFISSLGQVDFSILRIALAKLGFAVAEETAIGAQAVTEEYKRLLAKGEMKNFITSACPAACRLIQMYYPKALPYLAPVDSPMVAHAKMLRKNDPDIKVVFIGPCIAKKREADEHGIDAVLTFEELLQLLEENGIDLQTINRLAVTDDNCGANRAKAYPATQGIIRSFDVLPEGYRYLAVDGVDRLVEVLENIESLDHTFIEMNVCPGGCINGPCAIAQEGGMMRAEADINAYVEHEMATRKHTPAPDAGVSLAYAHPRLRSKSRPATDKEIEEVLRRTGKTTKADELDCGACGYRTCREKAWAVVNGYADIDICLPYMRKRAESLAVDIVRNSPEGVMIVDPDMNIVDINASAMKMLGLSGKPESVVGRPVAESFQPIDFYNAYTRKQRVENPRLHVQATNRYLSLTVSLLSEQNLLFGLMKDISDMVNYDKKLEKVRMDTIATTDELIMKQMRVAQEIASLLGETTAETKVALLKLKKTLSDGEGDLGVDGRPTDWKTAKI